LRVGIDAACRPGVVEITAGNYGGKLEGSTTSACTRF